MTKYEVIAVTLSIIAILSPFIQWLWKKWLVKPTLNFYPTGKAYLHYNKSGSYILIEGVFEALKKPITIRNISVKIIRKKDDATLNLQWSTFTSPNSQLVDGKSTFSTETAHPFRIETDNIVCAFTEFTDQFNACDKKSKKVLDNLFEDFCHLPKFDNYYDALSSYQSMPSYKESKSIIKDELFWDLGKYNLTIQVDLGNKQVNYQYAFDVNQSELYELLHNEDEILLTNIKSIFNVPLDFRRAQIELHKQ